MAYFNINLAEQRGLSPLDVFLLQLVHQNKSEDMSEGLALLLSGDEEMIHIKRLYELDLITMIKGTKKDTEFQKLRLSKKGKKWYRDLQTYTTVDNDFKMFESLKDIYLKEGKEIGSHKKTLELIAWFRLETGFTHKEIWGIAKTFVKDTDRMEYSFVLEKVFWSSANHFQTTPKLEDSKLWLYYEKNKEFFDKQFEKIK